MERLQTAKPLNNLIKILCVLVICGALFVGNHYFSTNVGTLIVFPAFLLFYVTLPGIAIIDFLGLECHHLSTKLVRGFFAGFALDIALYYIADLIGTDIFMMLGGPVLSAAWLIRLIRRGELSKLGKAARAIADAPAGFYVFFVLVFISSMLATQYTYITPEACKYSFIKIDFLYHAGIMNALSQNYPPHDPWVSGLGLQYHFFAEMLLSILVEHFGLYAEDILLVGTPLMITPVLTLSMYSFFREFGSTARNSGLYCIAFHLSNQFILKALDSSWFMYHIYSNINNAGLGLSCLLTVLPLLRMWDRDEGGAESGFKLKEMIFMAVLVMLMTGIKGPVSVVLVGGMIGTLLLGLILRKVDLKVGALAIICAVSFALIYVFVLGSQHSNTTGGALINPGEVTDIFFLKTRIMSHLGGFDIPVSACRLILFAVFAVFYMSAFFVPFIVGYLRELILVVSGRKPFLFSRVTVYACCFVGFAAMMILNFNGHSQVYFGFVTSMLVPAVVFWFFEDIKDKKNFGANLVRVIFVLGLCLSSVTVAMHYASASAEAKEVYLTRNENDHKYRNVSSAEYEGLAWLRDNSDEEDLIASDRYFSVSPEEYDYTSRGSNTHFAYAIYSQRDQYLEGSGFSLGADSNRRRKRMVDKNSTLFDPANPDRGDTARDLSVDYVVVSKRFNPVGDLSNEDYELCYSNEEMDIYKVKEAS